MTYISGSDRDATLLPTRRTVLVSGAIAVPSLALTHTLPGSGLLPQDFDRLEALVKMRGSTDGRVGLSWISGTRFAQVGSDMRPMCGLLNCTISRYTRIAPDAFDLRLYELSFYTDLGSGRYRPKLTMPFTGTTVDVPLYRTGPGHHVVKTANKEVMSWGSANTTSQEAAAALAPAGRIEYSVALSQPVTAGRQLSLTTDATTRLVPTDPEETPWFYKELISNSADLADLLDPGRTSVDSTASYTLMMGWRPWMQMGNIAGQTIDHAIGGRVWRPEDLPERIAWHLHEHHPEVAADPAKWLD